MDIDSRIIWLVYIILLAYPLRYPIGLPISLDPVTQSTYNVVNNLKPGARVAFVASLGGVSLPELYPIAKILIIHLFRMPDVKVIFTSFSVEGPVWVQKIMSEIDTNGRVYGIDYVYLGFTPGGVTAITAMANDLPSLVQKDYFGTSFNQLPNNGAILEEIKSAVDFDLLIVVQASGYTDYIGPWSAKYGIPTIMAPMSEGVPQVLTYYTSKQIIGLVKGARGGAEYEQLLHTPGDSIRGMDAQSAASITLITGVIIGNLTYYVSRKKQVGKGA
jgi:hypothetical protein